ncbi:MAG TPA: hypothetical protein VL242_43765, partial [Sorangium sp.]|nr:hypothetical protein [Sorangium sp.]
AFAVALAEFDAGFARSRELDPAHQQFTAHLRKQGADRLAETYRRELRPLSREQQAEVRRAVEAALAPLGLKLAPGATDPLPFVLGAAHIDVSAEAGLRTEAQVRVALAGAPVTEALRPSVPGFSCSRAHWEAWRAWADAEFRGERLVAWLEALLGEDQSAQGSGDVATSMRIAPARRLAAFVEERSTHLEFVPHVIAWSWLVEELAGTPPPCCAEHLEEQLPALVRYEDVQQVVDGAKAGWHTRVVEARRPSDVELTPPTPEQRQKENQQRSRIGAEAEDAFLRWAASTTREILRVDGDAAWAALAAAAPPSTELAARIEQARARPLDEPGPLEDVLHVSKHRGNAGFDVLGLERDGARTPIAVRYECKALPAGASTNIYLSHNEVNVYRSFAMGPEAGRWKLIGVHPDGTSFDLTAHLAPLADAQHGPLGELARSGITFDSVVLTVQQDRLADVL